MDNIYEPEYYVTPNDKMDINKTKWSIDESLKAYTKDIYDILAANFDKGEGNTIKFVKGKNGQLATIKITLMTRRPEFRRVTHPINFEVKIIYREGTGPCVDVIAVEKKLYANFKFEIFERNFMNMLMSWYNDKSKKSFALKEGKYQWKKYLIYEPLTSGK